MQILLYKSYQANFAMRLIVQIFLYRFSYVQNIMQTIVCFIMQITVRSIIRFIKQIIMCSIVYSIMHSIVCRIFYGDSIMRIIIQILLCKLCYVYCADYHVLRNFNYTFL